MIKGSYIIDFKEIDGVLIRKVKPDINGNLRYIIHKMFIDLDYKKAKAKGAKVGFIQCRAGGCKDYLVCSTCKGYSGVLELINKARNEK